MTKIFIERKVDAEKFERAILSWDGEFIMNGASKFVPRTNEA